MDDDMTPIEWIRNLEGRGALRSPRILNGKVELKRTNEIGDIYLICRRFKTFEIVSEAIFQLVLL